ncbi:MAG TPA: hypothetical protein IAC09_06360 [Candidatus Cryptobacteroides intestinipullorum]|mgnify:CR=1 FL=1|nr:hypothetical protein [Candidatus Cryptobacteroides intestinipullorum]
MVKHSIYKKVSAGPVLLSLLALPLSCVNEEFDISNIDTTVAFGGDALVFPLGSTEHLKLNTLLSEEDFEYITSLDGVYGFNLNDSMDLSKDLPDLSSESDVDAVSFSQSFDVSFGDINMAELVIDEQTFESDITFDGVEIPEFTIPQNTFQDQVSTGIYDYTPDPDQLEMDFGEQSLEFGNIFSEAGNYVGNAGDYEVVSIPDISNDLPERSFNVNVTVVLPDGINDVRDIILDPAAKMHVGMRLANAFLEYGSVVPDISLDLSQLVNIDGGTTRLQLGNDFELNQGNSYYAENEYTVSSLVIDYDNDWSDTPDGYTLDKSARVSAGGSVSLSGAGLSRSSLENSAAAGGMELDIDIRFENIVIDDMTLGIDEVRSDVNTSVSLEIDPIQLPEEIDGVTEVRLADGSGIDIEISGESLASMSGLSAGLEAITIKFPEEIVCDGLQDNTLVIQEADLKGSSSYHVDVLSIIPGEPDAEHAVNINSNIEVTAELALGGTVSLSSLPSSEADEPSVDINVTANMTVDHLLLEMDEVNHTIENQRKEFEIDLPDGLGEIGTFHIVPSGNPKLTIDVVMPQGLQTLDMMARNLKISFPDMLEFENADKYNYDESDNSINFTNEDIPEHIVLDISGLNVTPVQRPEGGYYAVDDMTYSGEASLVPTNADGIVTSDDVDLLVDDGIQIKAYIPAIDIDQVEFRKFETTVEETETMDLFDLGSLPEQVVGIENIQLSEAYLNLSFKANNLPDMGPDASAPYADLSVYLPVEINIDLAEDITGVTFEEYDENFNLLHITGEFDDEGYFEIDPVGISSLDLKNVDIASGGMLTREIRVTGRVSVDNPGIEPEELNGQSMSVDMNCTIASETGESTSDPKIVVGRITGYVDYKLGEDGENISQTISLDGLPDFVKGENFTLDFENPYIELAVNSNVGIPVNAGIEILPYYDGAADNTSAQYVSLVLPAVTDAQETTTRFWIAKTSDGMPSDYTWVEADIPALLSRIPEKIDLNVDAATDSEELSVIDTDTEYKFEFNYDVVVPFVFGDDLNVEMSYTVEDLPEILGQLIEMNSFGLGGYVESTLPLALELGVEMLDSGDNVIKTEPVEQPIAAGTADEPARTDLDVLLKLAEGADASDLSKMKMNFTVTSGGKSGEPVTEDSYLYVVLKVKVPGGITIDLSSLGEPENTDSENY